MNGKRKLFVTRLCLATIVVLFTLCLAVTGGGWYMVDIALTPNNLGSHDKRGSLSYMQTTYPQITPWLDSLQACHALRDTTIINAEGVHLKGYFVCASHPTKHTAILVHGYTDNAIRMLHIGYLYNHDLHYNIMIPDLQFHGESEGRAIQMGWNDRNDVIQWIGVAEKLFPNAQIVIHGISMGAATTLCVSGEKNLPHSVRAFVEDCGYTSVWDEFGIQIKEKYGMPRFPILYAASAVCKMRFGWSFGEASPLEQIKKAKLPICFIHGDGDSYVPTWMVYRLYAACKTRKRLWIAPNVKEHAKSYRMHPTEYTKLVRCFLTTEAGMK